MMLMLLMVIGQNDITKVTRIKHQQQEQHHQLQLQWECSQLTQVYYLSLFAPYASVVNKS